MTLSSSTTRMAAAVTLLLLSGCSESSHAPTAPAQSGQTPPVTTGSQLNENLGGQQLFPWNNWWNLDLTLAPVDDQSATIIDWISGRDPAHPTATRRLHPDFGPPPYGMPYITVDGTQPLVLVTFAPYGSQSDAGAPGRPAGYPIPIEARTQANWIEGGVIGGGTSGDRHMLIIDRDHNLLFETWATHWNANQARWEAGSGAAFDMNTNNRRPEGWTSADAAGLAILPGLIRADEVFGPGEIHHAFRFTTRDTNGHIWPASHDAGSNPSAPPMGTRLRMKAGTNISSYPPEIQKIFRAMKRYGLILADNGTDMYIQGTMDPVWDNDILNPAFHSLHADDFDVIVRGWNPVTSGVP